MTTLRSGRPEKPIPDTQPAKPLAEYLRMLRRRVGSPSYRILGPLVFLQHNALSQAADGRLVRWDRVERYVAALNLHQDGAVTAGDMLELRRLFQLARDGAKKQKQKPQRPHNEVSQLWEQVERDLSRSASIAAATRAPGQWHITHLSTQRQLRAAECVHDLVDCLRAAAVRLGALPGYGTTRNSSGRYRLMDEVVPPDLQPLPELGVDEQRMLTGHTTPDRDMLLKILKFCGGTDGDALAWAAAWQRLPKKCVHTNYYAKYYNGPQTGTPTLYGRQQASNGPVTPAPAPRSAPDRWQRLRRFLPFPGKA